MPIPDFKKKRQMRRRARKKRQKWLIATLLLILVPTGLFLLISSINLNTVLEKKLASYLAPEMKLSIGRTYLGLSRHGPAIRMQSFKVYNVRDIVVFDAKNAAIAFDVWSALRGWIVLRALSASDVNVTLVKKEGGKPQVDTLPDQSVLSLTNRSKEESEQVVSLTDHPVSDESISPKVPPRLVTTVYDFINGFVQSEGVIGALDHINLRRVHITQRERKEENDSKEVTQTLINKGDFTLSRLKKKESDSPSVVLSLVSNEEENPWSIFADLRPKTHSIMNVRITFENAPLFRFAQWRGIQFPFVTCDIPFSGTLVLALEPNALKNLSVSLSSEKGTLLIHDATVPKVPLNQIQFSAVWDSNVHRLVIPSLKFDSGPNRFMFSGHIHFFEAKNQDSPQWDFSLVSSSTILKGLTLNDNPLHLTTLSLSGEGFEEGSFKGQLIAKGEKIDVTISGEKMQTESPQIVFNFGVKKTEARHLLRLWPVIVAPNTYHYLADNLRAGNVDLSGTVRLNEQDLEQLARKDGVLKEEAIDLEVTVHEGVLTPGPHVPTLYNMNVQGKVTGQQAILQVSQARMFVKNDSKKQDTFSFDVSEGSVQLLDFYTTPQAHINFRAQSSVESVIAFLKTPLIDVDNRSILDSLQVSSGDSNLKIAISMPLNENIARKDVQVSGQGTLKNVTVGGVYGKENFSKANLSVELKNKETVVLDGKGSIFGLDTDLHLGVGDVEKQGLVLSTFMTDAIRKNKGWASQGLKGPIKISMDVPMIEGKMPFISIDLTSAEILHFVPGWVKEEGSPASLTFSLQGKTLENFSLSSKNFSAEGKGVLSDGTSLNLSTLDLKSVQWSKEDAVSVVWARTAEGSHTRMKGTLLNAIPLISVLTSLTGEKDQNSFMIDATIARVTGHHGEAISNFSLVAEQNKGKMTQFKLSGSLPFLKGQGKRNVTGSLLPLTTGDNDILIFSNEAGSLLRFCGLYRDMENGDLEFRMDTNVQPSIGRLSIKDFLILNNSFRISDQKTSIPSNNSNPFSKLVAQFIFGQEIVVRNGLILGPTTGIAIEGKINIKTGTLNLFGTYVPAYALNNTFAQIPLIGPILGGGPHEGLFAVSFQVTGPFETPKTTINPLSALTPGLLRKFFEISR